MLSDEQIIHLLRGIRFSPKAERNARRAPSINGLAQASGLSRMHLYRVTNGEPLTPRVRRELSAALTCHAMNGARTGGGLRNDGSHGSGRG